MLLENDGSADSLLVVCLAVYSRGFIFIGENFENCPTYYIDNTNIDYNNTILIDTILRCRKYVCQEPTRPEYQICQFKLKIPDRPVGSVKIQVDKARFMDECVPGFGINQDTAIYNISAIYYTHSRVGYKIKAKFSDVSSKPFRHLFQYLVSGNVSLPSICFSGEDNFRPNMNIFISTCTSFLNVSKHCRAANIYTVDNCFDIVLPMKPSFILIKHENYTINYSRHHIITSYHEDCPHHNIISRGLPTAL